MNRNIMIYLLIAMVLPGCSRREKLPQKTAPLPVEVITLENCATSTAHRYIGAIEEQQRLPLSSAAAGQLVELYVRTGQQVQSGDVLLRTDTTQAANALQSAAALLHQAEDGYERARRVHESGGATDQQMVELESKLKQAQAMYAMAKRHLDDCTLTAPCSGIVSECNVVEGQTLAIGVPVVNLLQIGRYYVRFTVPESEIASVREGQTGRLDVPAAGKENIRIRVCERQIDANPLAHTYAVKAEVSDCTDLMPGMACTVSLQKAEENRMVVPCQCIQQLPAGPTVWVVRDNMTAERRSIKLGEYMANGVVVTEGLAPGQQVISKGYQKLYNGAEVVLQ